MHLRKFEEQNWATLAGHIMGILEDDARKEAQAAFEEAPSA